MARMVGIDLGTTNSLCAYFADRAPKLIPNAHDETLTPSVVGILDDGRVLVGAAARELAVTQPERCAACFKRHMGSDRKITLAGRQFTAPELSSLVLKSLKHDAEAFFGEEIEEAVITVPAYFNDTQRSATQMAGKLAGLCVRRIINEPTAAALIYGFHERTAERTLIVIDLGGGTFDVTLMEVFEGTLEIVATAGESMLGGTDFTDRLVAAVLKQENVQLEQAELTKPLQVARLRQECERAKTELFASEEAFVRLPGHDGTLADDAKRFRLDRPRLATLSAPLIERLQGPIGKVLRDARKSPELVDEVILVGGATRMLAVREFVQSFFGKPPLVKYNPDEIVALGAAVQTALIENHADVGDMVMTDVCPFTLGVEVVKEFGSYHAEGYFSPIIHRNTTIPVSREEVYSTVNANQTRMILRVFQGEARRVKDNVELGQLEVKGIPPGPAGQPVSVRFTYDLNGILEVEAFVPDSGKRFRAVLTNHVRGLSDAEIEKAVRRMQELKFYPRDDVNNRRLVLFGERVMGEISPYVRQSLEDAIDFFEHSMSSGDRELFETARTALLVMLSQLGYAYEETSGKDEQDAGS